MQILIKCIHPIDLIIFASRLGPFLYVLSALPIEGTEGATQVQHQSSGKKYSMIVLDQVTSSNIIS